MIQCTFINMYKTYIVKTLIFAQHIIITINPNLLV